MAAKPGRHLEVVKLLVEYGADLDLKDTIHQGTPLGWAEHMGHDEIAVPYVTHCTRVRLA